MGLFLFGIMAKKVHGNVVALQKQENGWISPTLAVKHVLYGETWFSFKICRVGTDFDPSQKSSSAVPIRNDEKHLDVWSQGKDQNHTKEHSGKSKLPMELASTLGCRTSQRLRERFTIFFHSPYVVFQSLGFFFLMSPALFLFGGSRQEALARALLRPCGGTYWYCRDLWRSQYVTGRKRVVQLGQGQSCREFGLGLCDGCV